ncbi:MAG TPA: hypothetical protein VKA26_04145 [Ignavibacteriaceae bacterium]|nr:hypothetical protein [Ignavibacteriaceae bacterium]
MHFVYPDYFIQFVPKIIPGGIYWVYLLGLSLVAASISIFAKKFMKRTCFLLTFLLLMIIFVVDLPGLFDHELMQSSIINLLKDSALAAGSLLLAGVFFSVEIK